MQSLSATLQSHLPTLAGAGREPILPPLAHPPRTSQGQANGAPQNLRMKESRKERSANTG
jgi:hypothetical protein